MRNRTLALMALLAGTAQAQAQTVLWGNSQQDAQGTGTQIFQGPSGEVYIEQGAGSNQALANAPAFPANPSPQGAVLVPQTQRPHGTPLYVPPAPGEGTEQRPALIWRVSPQPPDPNLPAQPAVVPGQQQPTPPVDAVRAQPALQADALQGMPAPAGNGGPAYSQNPEAVRAFAAELTNLIRLAERYRAASPGFLEDLNELATKYQTIPIEPMRPVLPAPPIAMGGGSDASTTIEAPTASNGQLQRPDLQLVVAPVGRQAPTTEAPAPNTQLAAAPVEPRIDPAASALPPTSAAVVYLRDDFSDGEVELSPPWIVRQGNWLVDERFGLRSNFETEADAAPTTPGDLLKFLLGENTRNPAGAPGSTVALIESEVAIGNAFSMVANVTDHEGRGAAHFIMHQGAPNWLGYRLELRGGSRPLVVLTRRGASGYKDIMKVEAPGFQKGQTHQLRWARLSDGQMFVLLDGKPVITARDTVFRQGWNGFGFFVANGDMSLRNIRIAEPVEQ